METKKRVTESKEKTWLTTKFLRHQVIPARRLVTLSRRSVTPARRFVTYRSTSGKFTVRRAVSDEAALMHRARCFWEESLPQPLPKGKGFVAAMTEQAGTGKGCLMV